MITFTQAKSLNLTVYDGKPCLFHGSTKRYISSSRCIKCSKERSAACRSVEDKIKRRERDRILYRSKTSLKDWIKRNLKSVRIRARKKNVPFDLTTDYLLSIWTNECPVLGVNLLFMCSKNNPNNQATLDRIKPELGYVKGNVVYISNLANRIKSNATSEQIKAVANWLKIQEQLA